MAVRPKHYRTPDAPKPAPELVARDVLKDDHPLHEGFINWLGEAKPTRRKASEFLRLGYREARAA